MKPSEEIANIVYWGIVVLGVAAIMVLLTMKR